MKLIGILSLLLTSGLIFGCQSTRFQNNQKPKKIEVSGSIEITRHVVEETSSYECSFEGTFVNENDEPMFGLTLRLAETEIGAVCDLDGKVSMKDIPAGSYIIEFVRLGSVSGTVSIEFAEGDQVVMDGIVAEHVDVQLLKPIIYIYPEEKTEVEVELTYDGKLTTTYPKLSVEGWKVTAFPDGTLIDENEKEYYALYWEGEPRKPLGIEDGFVVSKEETIPFLEEKLALLGLNPKESNEFIIFWLPILEKNAFNLIHFAGDDYLEQAQLNISPTPETIIRVAMVFQGLDEEIEFPIQDLTPLTKTRSGFTVVEWGGQQLPKSHKLKI